MFAAYVIRPEVMLPKISDEVYGMRTTHLQEAPVDVVDDLHVPREQLLHEGHRPLLQCLGQHRVVCEGEHLCHIKARSTVSAMPETCP